MQDVEAAVEQAKFNMKSNVGHVKKKFCLNVNYVVENTKNPHSKLLTYVYIVKKAL